MPYALTVALFLLAFACTTLGVSAVRQLRRGRVLKGVGRAAVLVPLLPSLGVALLLVVGTWGYTSLTREQHAATVRTFPEGRQEFVAEFLFPDGRMRTFRLRGDQLYVDARIIKWKYWANLLGLRTSYELNRVAGRYRAVADERDAQRTVFALSGRRPVDLFDLRRRFSRLSPVLDAVYGSATFVPAGRPAAYEIRVSTTGLVARPAGERDSVRGFVRRP